MIKARGGTNGWRGKRVSCWRWWQRVLLLVWLVAPAEAASSAVGGVVAAVAAVAASTVLNYWAGMEDDTAGDLEVLSKGGGVIRIMSTNLRRVKRDETSQGGLEADNESSGGRCS